MSDRVTSEEVSDLRITYYGYNGFIIRSDGCKVAVDPGASLYLFGLGPVLPREEWKDITHIFVTHADLDHYWHADRVAGESKAPIICGSELVEVREGRTFIVSPRKRKLQYGSEVDRAYPMNHGDRIEVDGISVQALPAVHGNLELSFLFGLIRKTVTRKPDELFAKGETGFLLEVGNVRIANLGDTLFLPEWGRLEPDILMIPIGGRKTRNTMDDQEALTAVGMMGPKLVIPCHYDCGVLFSKRGNPADAESFKEAVESQGAKCVPMKPGQELRYPPGTLSDIESQLPEQQI
jgi:L-ascorbate metabolism protein UlaG (beta-lactamase superfamily)